MANGNPYAPAEVGKITDLFAGGQSIAAPGAPPIKDTTNPYAAMAAEMVGEIAMNAGAEYMAPEGEWNEDIGKWVYTKKPYSSMFGPYEIPEDSIWASDLPAWMKKLEIQKAKKSEEGAKNLSEFQSMFRPSISDAYNQVMLERLPKPLTEAQAIKYEGYDPEEVAAATAAQKQFIDPNASDVMNWYSKVTPLELNRMNDRISFAAGDIGKISFGERWIPDAFMSQTDKAAHREKEAFRNWVNDRRGASGAHFHFAPDGVVNYDALSLYEQAPMEYFRKYIYNK